MASRRFASRFSVSQMCIRDRNQWVPTAQKMAEGKYHMEGLATTFVKFSEIEKVFNNIVHPDSAVKKTVILFDGAED